MNAFDLLDAIGVARDDYIAAAVQTRELHPRRISSHRVLAVVLAAAMALLLVGCTVAYVLSLKELKIAEEPGIRHVDEAGEWAAPTEVTEAVISVRGYPGSSNQLATKEWYEFEQTYDPEKTLLTDGQPEGVSDSHYYAYGCYTRDMAEKVDAIAQKHGLKLLSPETVVQRWQMGVMFEALGIEGVCHSEQAGKVTDGAGYFYPEGNFKYEFDLCLPLEDGGVSPAISSYMLYTRKGYFDPDYQNVDTELFEEWTYTTPDGVEVRIAMSSWGGYFFAETEDAFVTVCARMEGTFALQDTEGWDRRCMEQMAQIINFSLKPEIPDMTGMEEKLAQAEQAHQDAVAAAAEKNRQSYATYGSYVKEKYIDGAQSKVGTPYARNYYALIDVTGDGQEELLLGRDQRHFNDLVTIRDGKVVAIAQWGNMNLCEGGIVLKSSYFPLGGDAIDDYDNPRTYGFCRMVDGEEGKKVLERFEFIDCNIETREWTKIVEATGEETPIIKEDIDAFLAQYPKLDIEMKPISEFPVD